MESLLELLRRPWPWWIVGPLVGLVPAALLLLGNRMFGVSSNLRHACAILAPKSAAWFDYDWRGSAWNLAFAGGTLAGGFVGGVLLAGAEPVALVPVPLFSWAGLATPAGFALIVGGGFLVGFGTAWAGGCTSGHGLTGVADLQAASFLALAAFFVGGIVTTWWILPLLLRGGGGA